MSTALHLADDDIDEHLAHVRTQTLTDLSNALRALNLAGGHIEALRHADIEFHDGRDGRDIAAHIDNAIRSVRASYAVIHMIVDKERP